MQDRRLEWSVILFMILNPLAAIAGLAYLGYQGVLFDHWGLWVFAAAFGMLGNLSITAGYHRLMSHKSYDAHPMVEWLFLLFGAATYEGTALKWSSDHHRHHNGVDTEKDPYNINKGFWYAHMGWLFRKDSVDLPIQGVADLQKNPRIMFQHKYYIPLSIFMAYVFPMLIGALFGAPFTGLIVGGAFRIILNQQSTFFVNSLCHTLGKQTYSKAISARDSFIVAVLTHGEGYHNFHHTFQIDYRNGIKWYHWDPTKWTIVSLKWLGMAKKLRTISPTEILKARLQTEGLRLTMQGHSHEAVEQMKAKILEAQVRFRKMKTDYAEMKRQAQVAGNAKLREVRYEIDQAKAEFKWALAQWRMSMRGQQLARAKTLS